MRVGIGNALTSNLVNVARECLLLHILPAKFLRNPVDLSQFVGVVVGNGDGFLVGVQNDLYGVSPPISFIFTCF